MAQERVDNEDADEARLGLGTRRSEGGGGRGGGGGGEEEKEEVRENVVFPLNCNGRKSVTWSVVRFASLLSFDLILC